MQILKVYVLLGLLCQVDVLFIRCEKKKPNHISLLGPALSSLQVDWDSVHDAVQCQKPLPTVSRLTWPNIVLTAAVHCQHLEGGSVYYMAALLNARVANMRTTKADNPKQSRFSFQSGTRLEDFADQQQQRREVISETLV